VLPYSTFASTHSHTLCYLFNRVCLLAQEAEGSLDIRQRKPYVTVSCSEALELLKSAFTAAAERDITLGDSVEFVIVSKDSTTRETLQLNTH
jgi:20S proteasome alpha/beta subunit